MHPIQKIPARNAGFTLPEMMVASAVFSMIMGSIVALNQFSARSTSGVTRMLELGSKANVLNVFCNDVKNATSADVQSYNGTTFSAIALGTAQQGNAVKILLPTGTNTHTVYYYVDSGSNFWRWNSTLNTSKKYLTDVTNTVVFTSEDYSGAIISNSIARTLIEVNLSILDSNSRDFRQALILRASAEVRNQ
jgi:prepilin-type N-terminal cleavage/methylation domain-containing protein